jgi:hypothetical protein
MLQSELFHVGLDGRTLHSTEPVSCIPADKILEGVPGQDLEVAARLALQGAGMEVLGVRIDADRTNYGGFSVVRALRVTTPSAVRDLALRVQPQGYAYGGVERHVRDLCVAGGLVSPRIHATHLDIPERLRPAYVFSLEDYIDGLDGYTHFVDRPQDAPMLIASMSAGMAIMHEQQVSEGVGHFDPTAAAQGVLTGKRQSYRQHVMAALAPILSYTVSQDFLTTTQAGNLYAYFRDARVIDTLNAESSHVLHGDMGLHNLRLSASDDKPHVVDFGETQAGPVAHDLAVASLFVVRNQMPHGEYELLRTYESHAGQLPINLEEKLRAVRARFSLSLLAGQATLLAGVEIGLLRKSMKATLEVLRADMTQLGM